MKTFSFLFSLVFSVCLATDLSCQIISPTGPALPTRPHRHHSSSKHSKHSKHSSRRSKHGPILGNFTLLATGKDNSVLLSNNIFYKPAHKHEAEKSLNWSIGDPIRVLPTKDKDRYIVVDLNTGESMKAKLLHWH